MIPLVLLPGMMCDARLFAPQFAALSGRYPMLAAPLVGADDMRGLAEDFLAYAPPCFALAGLSMGGILAMEIVRQAPARVAGLALLDTNQLAEREEIKQRRAGQIAAARAGDLARIMREDMKPNYLADSPDRSEILDLCMTMALALGPQVFVDQSLALRDRIDQSQTLKDFPRPALVLCGREDRLCPVERHELMAELLPAAHLEVVEGAGHLSTLEQPETVNRAFEDWLLRLA